MTEKGPSHAELYSYDRRDGPYGIRNSVTKPGECLVSIKVNEEYIAYSPFRVDICQSIGDAPKISVSALQQKEFTSQYAFEFIPRENGGHNIQLFFNNCGIPERPFRIMVGKEDCGPGMVHASEDDLKTGHIDTHVKLTCKLNIDGEGPSHAELYSYDRRDGPYGIRNSVTKPGECLVSIKVNEEYIAYSPFRSRHLSKYWRCS
ncbi:FLNA [Mytilus edulis]|uniref:FLNA n=1 Tax=Mytilus edulis TaxID=6550 RepID=A0A8S3QK48_MYTED|nr:FLNA [Mytilus edulis]